MHNLATYLTFLVACSTVVLADLFLRQAEEFEESFCGQADICNLVLNPRWGLNSVENLCKCPEGTFCPTNFSPNDGTSLLVNARTQMKFCTPLYEIQSDLEMCVAGGVAIRVETMYLVDKVLNVSASLLCNCNQDGPIYWKYHSRIGKFVKEDQKLFKVYDNFQCSELQKCGSRDFCGFARLDVGFIFQSCTCDSVHDCKFSVDEMDIEEDVESELFYKGLVYKSRCVKNETFEHW